MTKFYDFLRLSKDSGSEYKSATKVLQKTAIFVLMSPAQMRSKTSAETQDSHAASYVLPCVLPEAKVQQKYSRF